MTVLHFPARLTVVLARAADVGVVLRRGPAKWVRMIRWDTRGDTFIPGQWLHGRAGAPLDLSPDGTKLAYFATNFRPGAPHPMWTAVSRPPYFTALAFWPYSYGWEPGGAFVDDHTIRRWYWQDTRPGPPPGSRVPKGLLIDARPGVDTERLGPERDGWARVGWTSGSGEAAGETWRKPGPRGRGDLYRRPVTRGGGEQGRLAGYDRYEYLSAAQGRSDLLRDAEWADWDRRGRLLFARGGKLFAADVTGPDVPVRELADFNDMTPEAIEPPGWAKVWCPVSGLGRVP